MAKIYAGIYSKLPTRQADEFLMDQNQLLSETKLLPFYLWETLAHDFMLVKKNIIPKKEGKLILSSLLNYLRKAQNGKLPLNPSVGDVHENIEALLTKDIGKSAGWMHTARSRNDQVTTDQKLITKELFFALSEELASLAKILAAKAIKYKDVLMPGFTHLRVAMPSTFGFWWQAYLDQLIECEKILQGVFTAIDKNPLGAGASYGVNWPIDPTETTQDLGFRYPLTNALSAINARGIHEMYLLGPICALATIFSRLTEDVIILSMPQIGFLAIDEGFTSGSSIMPQKVNPDVAEKVRSKAGKLIGNFVTISVVLKGTPSGYNRDSSETKVAIIDSLTETIDMVRIVSAMMEKIIPDKENMSAQVSPALATNLADNIVKKYQIPFRQAHLIVGRALSYADKDTQKLTNILLEKSGKEITGKKITISKTFIKDSLNPQKVINELSYLGTPNPKFISKANEKLLQKNDEFLKWAKLEKEKFYQAKKNLIQKIEGFIK